ncbi:hypothetical protein PVL29_012579 [Vitis rotundifolia]|uniref:Uncharacterized protein n=1 Tax=Vitis rotundifolia TaxID=103349 RepID=A0AA39DN40_VITRO|nr:hypothetical protein PVL29_012579 [Vitis rotundifolia]
MVLKVDLGCDRCYKKIKKLLCKFPEDQNDALQRWRYHLVYREKKSPPERLNGAETPTGPPQQPTPVLGYPLIYPIGVYFKPCYEGHGGRRPCYHGYGIPCQPPSYDGPYGNWPSGCRCNRRYGCRCEFLTEENPTCTTRKSYSMIIVLVWLSGFFNSFGFFSLPQQ